MRIGLDYRPAAFGQGGIRVYVRELAAALAQDGIAGDLRLFAMSLRQSVPVAAAPRGAHLVRGRVPGRLLPLLAHVGCAADRLLGGVDVLHLTDYAPLPSARAAVVATIHDVLFDQMPDAYPASMRATLRARTQATLRVARYVIVPSAHTAQGLSQYYGVSAERIRIIAHGAPTVAAVDAPMSATAPPYVLCVGTLEPRKNVQRIVAAFRALPSPWQLRWVGGRGWLDEPALTALRSSARVHYEGPVSSAHLSEFYAQAAFVAYPSLGEGFGLPVLEAMAHGKAVLVGAGTAPAEVAGAGGLAVCGTSEEDLARGLLRLAGEPELRASLGACGLARAAQFTWALTAQRTRQVYSEACE